MSPLATLMGLAFAVFVAVVVAMFAVLAWRAVADAIERPGTPDGGDK